MGEGGSSWHPFLPIFFFSYISRDANFLKENNLHPFKFTKGSIKYTKSNGIVAQEKRALTFSCEPCLSLQACQVLAMCWECKTKQEPISASMELTVREAKGQTNLNNPVRQQL